MLNNSVRTNKIIILNCGGEM